STEQIYTDWANHYLAKSGCPRLIKDLSQDVTDGVLLAQIIQIIANEKVEDINGSPRSQSQMPIDPPPALSSEGPASLG
ncbi:Neuron navigator 3, partial [Ameca splendens]